MKPSFTLWLFRKTFGKIVWVGKTAISSVVNLHKNLIQDMVNDPGMGIPMLFGISFFLFLLMVVFPCVVYEHAVNSSVDEQHDHAVATLWFLPVYWTICGLIAARRAFIAEHQKLFDALKDGEET